MLRRALALLLAVVVTVPFARAQDDPRERDDGLHVVVLSIDGLRPDFYRRDDFEAPTLRELASRGASADAVEAAFPSLTYPGHTSIVTGMRPARHGIVANTRFDEHGARPEWLWETSHLKAKPLWQAAHEQGKKVAITQWPVTVGSDVDWLVPERWSVDNK